MATAYFPVYSTVLSHRALAKWLNRTYPLEGPLHCRLYQSGINDVYRVKTGSSLYYLRVSRPHWRSRRDQEEEIDLLNHLLAQDIPVARPVPHRQGAYLGCLDAAEGERYAVLFAAAEGDTHDALNPRQNYVFGRVTGRLHSSADRLDRRFDKFHLDEENLLLRPVERICRYLQDRPALCRQLEQMGELLKTRVNGLPRTPPIYGICHGDLHSYNVYFDPLCRPTLIDFDNFGYGWRIYDIAVYVANMINVQEGQTDRFNWMEGFNDFLRGYGEIRAIDAGELQRLHVFIVIRQLYQMGIHITYYRYRGAGFIDHAYFEKNLRIIQRYVRDFKIL